MAFGTGPRRCEDGEVPADAGAPRPNRHLQRTWRSWYHVMRLRYCAARCVPHRQASHRLGAPLTRHSERLAMVRITRYKQPMKGVVGLGDPMALPCYLTAMVRRRPPDVS